MILSADSALIGESLKKLIKSLKIKEQSQCIIKKEFLASKDKEYCTKNGINLEQDLKIVAELHNFISVDMMILFYLD